MKVLISGSRAISDFRMVELAIERARYRITYVVTGEGIGPEHLAQHWAKLSNVPYKVFTTDLQRYGEDVLLGRVIPYALEVRNQDMVNLADAAILVWDGESRSTADIIERATLRQIPVYVHRPKDKIEERWWL